MCGDYGMLTRPTWPDPVNPARCCCRCGPRQYRPPDPLTFLLLGRWLLKVIFMMLSIQASQVGIHLLLRVRACHEEEAAIRHASRRSPGRLPPPQVLPDPRPRHTGPGPNSIPKHIR